MSGDLVTMSMAAPAMPIASPLGIKALAVSGCCIVAAGNRAAVTEALSGAESRLYLYRCRGEAESHMKHLCFMPSWRDNALAKNGDNCCNP
jgi:hypothetical protein